MRSLVIGTAGHIDHGKSALVRALTGTDPDRLKEERERGITIDLGFAHLARGDVQLAFVDVPGHERFVKNMLAGAGGIDAVMLIVAADESVMPQTREHFHICRLLGVRQGIVVLTKSDLADPDMLAVASDDVRELVAGSFLEDAPVLAVSARTGDGLADLEAVLFHTARSAAPRRVERPARLPVDRVFSVKGFGTVVTGTLVSGRVVPGDTLVVLPAGREVKARGLHVHGAAEAEAAAGQRLAVNVGGIEVAEMSRGDTVCMRGAAEITQRLDVAISVVPGAPPLKHGARVRFHQGTSEVLGRVAIVEPRGGEDAADGVRTEGPVYARIRLESPAVLTRGDRFILRSYSPATTIAGGIVLDPLAPRGAVRSEETLQRFRAIANDVPDGEVIARVVLECGARGLAYESLMSRLGLGSAAAKTAVEALPGIAGIGGLLIATVVLERLEASAPRRSRRSPRRVSAG